MKHHFLYSFLVLITLLNICHLESMEESFNDKIQKYHKKLRRIVTYEKVNSIFALYNDIHMEMYEVANYLNRASLRDEKWYNILSNRYVIDILVNLGSLYYDENYFQPCIFCLLIGTKICKQYAKTLLYKENHKQDAEFALLNLCSQDNQDINLINMLLCIKCSPNTQQKNTKWTTPGRTALTSAIKNGNSELVKLLLEHKADTTLKNPATQCLPLTVAITSSAQNKKIIKLLIENKADINAQEKHTGNTALMWAALYADVSAVQLLINHKVNSVIKNKNGQTASDFAKKMPLIEYESRYNRIINKISDYENPFKRRVTV